MTYDEELFRTILREYHNSERESSSPSDPGHDELKERLQAAECRYLNMMFEFDSLKKRLRTLEEMHLRIESND